MLQMRLIQNLVRQQMKEVICAANLAGCIEADTLDYGEYHAV